MSRLQDTDTQEIASDVQSVEAMRSVIEAPSAPESAPRRALKAELTERADLLASATKWTREQFLEQAGCSSAELVIKGKPSIDFLLACLSYLMWVEDLVADLDVLRDKHAAVQGAARLFRDGERDLDLCKGAMSKAARLGELSALEFLSLGEVVRAFQVATGHLDMAAGRRIQVALLQDPLYLHSPHVLDDRIELAWTSPETIGKRVAGNIRKHVVSCAACTESYSQKLEHL